MGREGPGLYCKDNTGVLVKGLIPERKLSHCSPARKVTLCYTMLCITCSLIALSYNMKLGSISLEFQLFTEK